MNSKNMESKLRQLLDKVYELEGLVHLSLKREEASEDFIRLISQKGKEVGRICKCLAAENPDVEEKIEEPVAENLILEEYSLDEEEDEYEEPEEYYEEPEEEELPQSEKPKKEIKDRGKLIFTINERYRFKKELFKDSDADFNTTMAFVASMDDYEEAEEYFVNEEGFNMSNPVVMEFLEVIKNYFS